MINGRQVIMQCQIWGANVKLEENLYLTAAFNNSNNTKQPKQPKPSKKEKYTTKQAEKCAQQNKLTKQANKQKIGLCLWAELYRWTFSERTKAQRAVPVSVI